jgi:hypothetical protein
MTLIFVLCLPLALWVRWRTPAARGLELDR